MVDVMKLIHIKLNQLTKYRFFSYILFNESIMGSYNKEFQHEIEQIKFTTQASLIIQNHLI